MNMKSRVLKGCSICHLLELKSNVPHWNNNSFDSLAKLFHIGLLVCTMLCEQIDDWAIKWAGKCAYANVNTLLHLLFTLWWV